MSNPELGSNQPPYFNNFDENNDFKSILFASDKPLQSAEINELQSLTQNQISKISSHIFKKGSPLTETQPKYIPAQPFVVVENTLFEIGSNVEIVGSTVTLNSLVGLELLGLSSGLKANVEFVKETSEGLVLFLDYTNTAVDNTTTQFLDGEFLEISDLSIVLKVNCPDCTPEIKLTSGIGSLFSVNKSEYWSGEFFLVAQPQTVLVGLTTKETATIGFLVLKSIVTSDDTDLLIDPSKSGHISGADRLKISLLLSVVPENTDNPTNFIEIAKISNGIVTSIFNRPRYSDLMDTLARRTNDESGSYSVEPFNISFEDASDSEKFQTLVSPGKAYVRGREIEFQAQTSITVARAREQITKRSISTPVNYGNFIRIKIYTNIDGVDGRLVGFSNTITSTNNASHELKYSSQFPISFYGDVVDSNNKLPGGAQILGTSRVKTMILEKVDVSEDRGVDGIWIYNEYRLYIYDLKFTDPTSTKLSDIKSFAKNLTGDHFVGEVISSVINDKRRNSKIFPISIAGITTTNLIDSVGVSSVSMIVEERIKVDSVPADKIVSISIAGNDSFVGPVDNWVCGVRGDSILSWPPFPLTASNTSISGNTLTIDLSSWPEDIAEMFVLAKVQKNNATPISKIISTEEREFTVDTIDIDNNKIFLERPDCLSVESIVHINGASVEVDVTSEFRFKTNQQENFYGTSYIESKSNFWPTASETLRITFKYFVSVDLTATSQEVSDFAAQFGQFFSIESYKDLLTFDSTFNFEDIPTFKFDDGEQVSVSDCFDFRGMARWIDKSSAHNENFTQTAIFPLGSIPTVDSSIVCDITHYFNRVDSLCLTDSGELIQIQGKSENIAPKVPSNSMKLFEVHIPKYTPTTTLIKKLYIDNKRYTMQDIGTLDKRISNIEEYVAFSLLEQETDALLIVDENGLSRFKNGLIVSNFKSYLTADLSSNDFKAGLNTHEGILIPQFSAEKIDLVFKSGSNFKRFGNVFFQEFTEELLLNQDKSSGDISVNPFFFYKRVGELTISPSVDTWIDNIAQPKIVVDIDSGFDELLNSSDILKTQWGAWETTSSEITKNRTKRGVMITDSVSTQTALQQKGIAKEVTNKVSKYGAGNNITSVSIQPFIREQSIQLYASGLLPNTIIHVFFEKVNIDKYCLNLSNGLTLETNSAGAIAIIFNIPTETFYTGKSKIVISNTTDYPVDQDEVSTFAESTFFSGGLTTNSRGLELSVTTPEIKEIDISREKVIVENWQTTWRDPVAQSFLIDERFSNGVFISSAKVEFTAIGNIPVWLELRGMLNGIPTSTALGGSRVVLFPHQVRTGQLTTFTFNIPVHLNQGIEYCIVVGSASKQWRIKTAQVGELDETTQEIISTQPSLGSLFKSQNGSTWTPDQYKDLKFQLSICKFNTSDVQLELKNSISVIFSKIESIETLTGNNLIRIKAKDHNLQKGDIFTIQSVDYVDVTLISGEFAEGITITGVNGSTARVSKVENIGTSTYRLFLDNIVSISGVNIFVLGESITAPSISRVLNNTDSMNVFHGLPAQISTLPVVGAVVADVTVLENMNNQYQVTHINSMDEFTYTAPSVSSVTGVLRNTTSKITKNVKLDSMIFNLNYINFGNTSENFSITTSKGFSGNATNIIPNLSIDSFVIPANDEIYLDSPMVIRPHLQQEDLIVEIVIGNDDEYSTPVINLDSSDFLGISNRTEYQTDDNGDYFYNVGLSPTDRIISEEKNISSGNYKFIMKPAIMELTATRVKVLYELAQIDGIVDVYIKSGIVSEGVTLEQKEWKLIDSNSRGVSAHLNDFIEIEFESEELQDFNIFVIKIAISNKNSAKPSRIRKLRVIATT